MQAGFTATATSSFHTSIVGDAHIGNSTCRGKSSSPSNTSFASCETFERMFPATPPIRLHMSKSVCTESTRPKQPQFQRANFQPASEEEDQIAAPEPSALILIVSLVELLLDSLGSSCCATRYVRQLCQIPVLMLSLPCLLGDSTSLQKVPQNNPRCSTSQNGRKPRPLRHFGNYRHSRTVAREAQPRQQDSRPSPVQDAQDSELATADRQAKQDLYAQLLDRQTSSRPGEVSTSGDVAAPQPRPSSGQSGKGSTELIFRLERRGEGWGEEIFPHLVVEQRPWTTTAKRDRNRSSRPKPWTV